MVGEGCSRKVGHMPPKHWHMVTVADGSSCACQRMEHCLKLGFLPTCRSGRDDPDGGFAGRR